MRSSIMLWAAQCVDSLELDVPERRLRGLLSYADRLRGPDGSQRLRCELEAEHTEAHHARAWVYLDEDHWWWRWDDTGTERSLIVAPVCGQLRSPGEPGTDYRPCRLPWGHDGLCTYTRPPGPPTAGDEQ